jgi:hypothetical protein
MFWRALLLVATCVCLCGVAQARTTREPLALRIPSNSSEAEFVRLVTRGASIRFALVLLLCSHPMCSEYAFYSSGSLFSLTPASVLSTLIHDCLLTSAV